MIVEAASFFLLLFYYCPWVLPSKPFPLCSFAAQDLRPTPSEQGSRGRVRVQPLTELKLIVWLCLCLLIRRVGTVSVSSSHGW